MNNNNIPPEPFSTKKSNRGTGGYMSQRSYDCFIKRILRAIMTNDDFIVVFNNNNTNTNNTSNNNNINTKVQFLLTAGGREYYNVMKYIHNN